MNCIRKPSFHVWLRVKENGYAIQLFDIPEGTDTQGKSVKLIIAQQRDMGSRKQHKNAIKENKN